MSEDKYSQFLAIINALEDEVNNLNAKVKVYEDFIGKHKNVEEEINKLKTENERLKKLLKDQMDECTKMHCNLCDCIDENDSLTKQNNYLNALVNSIYNYLLKRNDERLLKDIIFSDFGRKHLSSILVSYRNLYDFLVKKIRSK